MKDDPEPTSPAQPEDDDSSVPPSPSEDFLDLTVDELLQGDPDSPLARKFRRLFEEADDTD